MENITSRLGGCNVAEGREEGVVHVRLADQQADPNSPLYSVKSFEELGLSRKLLMGLYAMPYTKPSKFQERVLPLLINDPPKNMIGQSQSGTGKTATIVLTMLTRLNLDLKAPQAICLAPSRELACQIIDVLQEMGKFTGVTSTLAIRESLVRDAPIYSQVVIGTPGTVCGVIRQKQLSVEAIKILVLDEADEMLDSASLGDQSIRIKRCIPGNPQLVLFSATFPEHVRNFANQFASGANEISLRREDLSANAIKQFYMVCESDEHKYETLCNIYDLLTVSQSIIFCERRDTSDEIARRMIEQGHLVKSLHGTMLPDERDSLMDGFRRGIFKVLISTNVIARGIDIPQVSLVINYDLHFDKFHIIDFESYLHRIGRTGRFGCTGVSIILIDSKKAWDGMKRIERHFCKEIAHVPTDDWQNVEYFFKGVI
ncbi:P-loop containing nucleoside triphosphate hydrolase protein [Helicostylum pulchrum]|nr:P-loop containing nucleoside triphosphate hydrolase protein [Helicostylum pulchrum]